MVVTRSSKGKAKPAVELQIKPKKTKKKIIQRPPSPPSPPTPRPLPVEVFQNILRHAETSSLGQCMRVSKLFYQIAGPLLYSNIIIDEAHPISSIVIGDSLVDRDSATSQPAAVNLKKKLLSLIQHVTVASHICPKASFPLSLLRINTLLIVPRSSCDDDHYLCMCKVSCPFIAKVRPQKVVLHHSRLRENERTDENDIDIEEQQFPLTIRCPTLTLVLDETGCVDAVLDHEMSYQRVDLEKLKELRIIAHRTPKWLDKVARRSTCSSGAPFEVERLATRILGPVISPIIASKSISISIYVFRKLDSESLADLKSSIDTDLGERLGRANLDDTLRNAPPYIIKTLSDYISEGLEDELLPEELKYWRERYQKRLLGEENAEELQELSAQSDSGSSDGDE